MKIGDVVVHKRKESDSGYPHDKSYLIKGYCRMKNSITGEWEDAIIYGGTNGESYVREIKDFMDKFQKVKL